MTAGEFRDLALSFRGATEGSHMRHPDFRAHGRVFATLGYPDGLHGMVKVKPEEQQELVSRHPQAFTPVKGAWGLHGCTSVLLATATSDVVAGALESAWRRSADDAAKKPRKAAAKKVKTLA
jgi:hypothetical protein